MPSFDKDGKMHKYSPPVADRCVMCKAACEPDKRVVTVTSEGMKPGCTWSYWVCPKCDEKERVRREQRDIVKEERDN